MNRSIKGLCIDLLAAVPRSVSIVEEVVLTSSREREKKKRELEDEGVASRIERCGYAKRHALPVERHFTCMFFFFFFLLFLMPFQTHSSFDVPCSSFLSLEDRSSLHSFIPC